MKAITNVNMNLTSFKMSRIWINFSLRMIREVRGFDNAFIGGQNIHADVEMNNDQLNSTLQTLRLSDKKSNLSHQPIRNTQVYNYLQNQERKGSYGNEFKTKQKTMRSHYEEETISTTLLKKFDEPRFDEDYVYIPRQAAGGSKKTTK